MGFGRNRGRASIHAAPPTKSRIQWQQMNQSPKQRWPTVPLVTGPRPRLYAAERRFDLITLLTIMTAYALLFAIMRLFRWETVAFALVAGLVTCVGLGQAFLFHGNAPRGASALVGAIYLPLSGAIVSLIDGEPIDSILCIVMGSIIQCAFAGYISGVLVGGVFMAADFLRNRLARIENEKAQNFEDSTANSEDEAG